MNTPYESFNRYSSSTVRRGSQQLCDLLDETIERIERIAPPTGHRGEPLTPRFAPPPHLQNCCRLRRTTRSRADAGGLALGAAKLAVSSPVRRPCDEPPASVSPLPFGFLTEILIYAPKLLRKLEEPAFAAPRSRRCWLRRWLIRWCHARCRS